MVQKLQEKVKVEYSEEFRQVELLQNMESQYLFNHPQTFHAKWRRRTLQLLSIGQLLYVTALLVPTRDTSYAEISHPPLSPFALFFSTRMLSFSHSTSIESVYVHLFPYYNFSRKSRVYFYYGQWSWYMYLAEQCFHEGQRESSDSKTRFDTDASLIRWIRLSSSYSSRMS